MFKKIVVCLFITNLLSCGNKKDQVIRKVTYELNDQYFNMNLEFNADVELNTEFIVPVKDYGFVHLYPPIEEKGFTLGFSLSLDIVYDSEIASLNKTIKLPNGQRMARYVSTDVAELKIDSSEKVNTYFYVGLDPDKFYLGTAIELFFMDQDFPSELVITQRLRDDKKRSIGVISLYGPKIDDGEMISPGGVFFMTNVTDLVEYSKEDKGDIEEHLIQLLSKVVHFPGSDIETFKSGHKVRLKRKDLEKVIAMFKKYSLFF